MRIDLPPDEPDDIYDYEPNYAQITEYMNIPSWKCSDCGTNNFGRNAHCVYCRLRQGKLVSKSGE